MARSKIGIGAGFLLLVLVAMIATCPGDADYANWLEKNHRISCFNDGLGIHCNVKQGGQVQVIHWKARAVTDAVIFKRVKDYYLDEQGNPLEICAFGMFKMFINY